MGDQQFSLSMIKNQLGRITVTGKDWKIKEHFSTFDEGRKFKKGPF